MKENYIKILISSNDLGKRVDIILSSKINDFSRNRIQNLILAGNVKLDDRVIKHQSLIIKEQGILSINMPQPQKNDLKPKKIDLEIHYEDESLIVLNKQAGIVVHPGAGNYENTLVNALLYHCKGSLSGIGGVLRPGIVHRIDKMTSGLIVVAKDDFTHNELSKQFKKKSIHRTYNCLTWNTLNVQKGTIKKNIVRSKVNRKKMVVCDKSLGKEAITEYQIKKIYNFSESVISFIECKLSTGRTHQIRVHLNHLGTPIIGDFVYKRNVNTKCLPENVKENIEKNFIGPKRQALHAKSLGFFHPKKKKRNVL